MERKKFYVNIASDFEKLTRHVDKDYALTEALRLANKHQNKHFYTLEVIGCTECEKLPAKFTPVEDLGLNKCE